MANPELLRQSEFVSVVNDLPVVARLPEMLGQLNRGGFGNVRQSPT